MNEQKKTRLARLHDGFWASYQRRTNLLANIAACRRFYEGDHWPEHEQDGSVRVVDNKIMKGIRSIASRINGTPIDLAIRDFDCSRNCDKIKRLDRQVLSYSSHDAFTLQAIINAENLGTEVTYVYWDPQDDTPMGSYYKGGLCMEHIPLECFAVANPHQKDIQKQEWVMFWTDVYEGRLEALIDEEPAWSEKTKEEKKAALRSEAKRSLKQGDANADRDILNETLLRVYVRYFRINGEVCHESMTESVELNAYPIPLSSLLSQDFAKEIYEKFSEEERQQREINDIDIDFERFIVTSHKRELESAEKHKKHLEKFSLYPFAIYAPMERDSSIFGVSKTEQMIPLNMAIDYNLSLETEYAQNVTFGKLVQKNGALRNQVITNRPGEILTDYSDGQGFGVKALEVPPMPNSIAEFNRYLGTEMENTYDFNEAVTGQMSGNDASGVMASLMISQANAPIQQEQMLFNVYREKLAYIRLMFYKHYFDEVDFTYELTQGEWDAEERARKTLLSGVSKGLKVVNPETGEAISPEAVKELFGKETARYRTDTFRRKDIWGVDFTISVKARRGIAESELAYQQFYNNMITSGTITNMDPDMLRFMVETAPESVIPDEGRAVMRYYAERKYQSALAQKDAQIAQLMSVIENQQGQLQGAQQFNRELGNEFNRKIAAANSVMGQRQQAAQQSAQQSLQEAEQAAEQPAM